MTVITGIKISVLGVLEITEGGREIRLAGQMQRTLVAALALDFGRVVPLSRLVDVLWEENPPKTARAKVQDHVSSLRRAIGHHRCEPKGLVLTSSAGYLLNPQSAQLDLAEFETLTGRARTESNLGHHAAAAELLAAALGLWRGAAFADVPSRPVQEAAAALEGRRLLAVEAKAESDLAEGHDETAVAELSGWLSAYPLRERLRGLLMRAYYGLGCRADALALYREGRQAMVDQLGVEPGSQLSALHERILADDMRR